MLTHKPLLDDQFFLPEKSEINKPLLLGALIFGVGWGLAGYCPGPAIAALAMNPMEPLIFVAAMVAGNRLSALVHE